MTQCADAAVQQGRVAGRQRGIPNWYELDWDHVARARDEWAPLDDVDLVLDTGAPGSENAAALRSVLTGWRPEDADQQA
jgi:hypothetical protein